MRTIVWLIRLAVFALLLVLAIKNTESVIIDLFLGYYLEAPLIVFLLGMLLIGILLGMLLLVPTLMSKRRKLAQLRKELQQRSSFNPLPAESEAQASPRL